MDVVYVLAQKPATSLRWSLRSLAANMPHDRVWFVGGKPPGFHQVEHIRTQQFLGKWLNATGNMRAACESHQVSDDFILFNDDFFVTAKVDGPPSYHRGSIEQMYKELSTNRPISLYGKGALKTLELMQADPEIEEPYVSYDLHTPMVFNKRKMRTVLAKIKPHQTRWMPCILWRSYYGNLYQVPAEYQSDCKAWKPGAIFNKEIPYLSTAPGSFKYQIKMLEKLFPEKCKYEI